MTNYAYEARDTRGELVAGIIAAKSLEHAGQLLSSRNLFVVRMATEAAQPVRTAVHGRANRADVAWQISQLSVMLQAGIPLSEALDCLVRQAAHPRLRALLESVARNVREGRSLSDAMVMHPDTFPSTLIAMVRAGEMTGTMTQVLQRSSDYLIYEMQTRRKIRAAMLYPLFMLALCLVVSIVLLLTILPRFADIFANRGALLPLPTRILMGLSEHLIAYWYIWLGHAFVMIVALYGLLRSALGQRLKDHLLISLPILSGVFNALYQGRMFRTMAELVNSGVPVIDSVEIVQDVVSNNQYRELWKRVRHQIQMGERICGPLLESELIPESYAQMIDSGDSAGRLGFVFSRLADFVEQDYDQKTRTAMQFIQPCMILIMGILIGAVVLSLMLPLFQASKVIAG